MQTDTKSAIGFLQKFRPDGPWTLTAIVPDGRISTQTFRSDQADMAVKWIEANNVTQNIYFQVNSAGTSILTKKAKKEHIRSCEWLHVDVDPTTEDPELFDADRKRILARIEDYSPAPNLIIDSGGGYQAFWKLDELIESDGPRDWSAQH